MLPRVDNILKPIATIEAPSAVATIAATKQEVASLLDKLVIGKQLQAQVVSRLNDGTFFVKIAGATARMALPQNLKAGDSISLTLLALTPRPRFSLEGEHAKVTTTAVFSGYDLLKNIPQDPKTTQNTSPALDIEPSISYVLELEPGRTETVSSQKPITSDLTSPLVDLDESTTASAPTSLSNTGKLINQILKEAQQQDTPTTLIGKTVLLQSSEELLHPEKLAAQLQQTISSSGLFYESHVAKWAAGKLPITDLMREPQAQNTNANANAANFNEATASIEEQTIFSQIVHLQLDASEQQRILWQGKLLPDLPMEWEIRREQDQTQENDEEGNAESNWQSAVRFEMPQLGSVAATINMRSGQLQLLLRASMPETVNALQKHAAELTDSLKQAGSPIVSFSVKQDEQT